MMVPPPESVDFKKYGLKHIEALAKHFYNESNLSCEVKKQQLQAEWENFKFDLLESKEVVPKVNVELVPRLLSVLDLGSRVDVEGDRTWQKYIFYLLFMLHLSLASRDTQRQTWCQKWSEHLDTRTHGDESQAPSTQPNRKHFRKF